MYPRRTLHERSRLVHRDDRGIGTTEYVGIVALAVILVTALILAVTNSNYGEQLAHQLCRITSLAGGGSCDEVPTESRAAEDYIPLDQCVVGANGQSGSVKAGVLLTGGAGGEWLIEEMGDGTFRLTRAGDLQGGVAVGIGFDVNVTADGHAYGAGATAGASADIVFGGGEVYHASSREEAEAILSARNVGDVKTAVVGDRGPARWAVDGIHGIFGDTSKEQLEPDERFIEGGTQIEGNLGLHATVVNADAALAVEQMLGVVERADGTYTAYLASEAELTGSLDSIQPGAVEGSVKYGELSGELSGKLLIEVDYNADGQVVGTRTRSAYTVDGTNELVYNSPRYIDDPTVVNEVVFHLPVASDEDRAVTHRMMQSAGIPYLPGLSDQFDIGDYAHARTLGMRDAIRDYGQAAMSDGYVWRQQTTEDVTENGFTFDAAYIAKLQVAAEATSTRRVLTGYDYFNGQEFVPREGCGAGLGG